MIDSSQFLQTWPCPDIELTWGRYALHFVRTPQDLDRVLKLRFDVFNVELNEGLKESFQSQRDQDKYDSYCHHIMVIDTSADDVVGTYRMQTYEMAHKHIGFYSAQEFDFSTFPMDILKESVEVGRACIHKDHRNGRVLSLLWKGLARYLLFNQKRYLFGCCSLPSDDIADGYQLWCDLKKLGAISERCHVQPNPEYTCFDSDYVLEEPRFVKMPHLFQIYISYYGYMCGPPALDRCLLPVEEPSADRHRKT